MEGGTVAGFIATFIIAVRIFYFENIDPNLKPRDTPQVDLRSEYDFVIVGAGSAGCVLANRLSEIGEWNILLIEAGGDEDAVSEAPYLDRFLSNTRMDWNSTTVEQKNVCRELNGKCKYTMGRVLGGSSAINYMFYSRGAPEDYDEWAELGNTKWSYRKILPYFIKSENASSIRELQGSRYRGMSGPVNVQYSRYMSRVSGDYIRAGVEFGLKVMDYNGKILSGVGRSQNTMYGPSRASAAKSYLNPIRERANLQIIKHSLVTRIIIDPKTKTATGVEYIRDNATFTVSASKEVIISAGAVNSPPLLMLSGIGPADHLQSLGINVIKNLPVGRNMKDHLSCNMVFELNKNASIAVYNNSELEYAELGTGPLTTSGVEVVAYLTVEKEASVSDILLVFGQLPISTIGESSSNLINIFVVLLKPFSVGSVRLKSKDPTDAPLIDPNYLADPRDYETLKNGIKSVASYIQTPSLQKYNLKLRDECESRCTFSSSTSNLSCFENDEFIECLIANNTNTAHHPAGTVKMGPDSDREAILDQFLRVKGIRNLRVIDASVMPNIIRGNTNAPVMMIGEKGAALIKYDYSNNREYSQNRESSYSS